MKSKIRVLLVDDSILHLTILKNMLSESPDIEVIATAKDGKEALALVTTLNPDVICTDLNMPIMDGLQLTEEVMKKYPRPILVLSAAVQKEDSQNIFRLLEAGAVDVYPKPRGDIREIAQDLRLIQKIKIISEVFVFSKKKNKVIGDIRKTGDFLPLSAYSNCPIVAIGASTGGPTAIKTIIQEIPDGFPATFICVQHIAKGFLQGLIDWLQESSALPIMIAEHGKTPLPSTIYFPPENMHLEIDKQGKFRHVSSSGELNCPSIDITFSSLVQHYGSSIIGVLLTGMGDDGSLGMQKIAEVGGITIAQDESTSLIFGMPKRAIELSAAYYILPIEAIAEKIMKKIYS